ncbi:MAG: hypothetical protein ACPGNT_11040, partial [Rhodospirillales bacterium]
YFHAQARELMGDMAGAVALLDKAGLAPGGDWDNYPFAKHRSFAENFPVWQDHARLRGVPPIPVVSLPKSGSSFICTLLHEVLFVTWCRTAKAGLCRGRIVPSWLRALMRGGATTHDHYPASAENRAALEAQEVKRLFVQLRHPAGMALSLARHLEQKRPADLHPYLRDVAVRRPEGAETWERDALRSFCLRTFYRPALAFCESWLDYREAGPLDIRIGTQEAMDGDPAASLREIDRLFDLGLGAGRLDAEAASARKGAAAQGAHNLASGQRLRWQDAFGTEDRDFMASFDTSPVFPAFGWEKGGG